MRLDLDEAVARVTLSERNLLTLLVKLRQPWSARTIFGCYAYRHGRLVDDLMLVVRAKTDNAHYANREPPGAMHPATEVLVAHLGAMDGRRSNGRPRS